MRLIVITRPEFIDSEAEKIVALFSEKGVDLVHIRKPGSSPDQVRSLLLGIPQQFHSRLVLHDHFSLAVEFGLYGVHLNSRNPLPPENWKGYWLKRFSGSGIPTAAMSSTAFFRASSWLRFW